MEYRYLGNSGLQVSLLSFGSWVNFGNNISNETALDCMKVAWEAGVNFFDNAENYDRGLSEKVMGECLAKLAIPRHHYVVSSKFFWGIDDGVINTHYTLNRKYLMNAVEKSLKRFGLEHLDLIYAHRPDPKTPIEETVWTMHNIIQQGKALYWGTSEWSAEEIRTAMEVANRHHLHRPLMEQPEYNLFNRQKVEYDYRPLYRDYKLGLTIFSPLASGLLTGKYIDGLPQGSRASLAGYEFLKSKMLDKEYNSIVKKLKEFAEQELGCSVVQLAIAWCMHNPHVSSVILGASRASQLSESLKSSQVKLDESSMKVINDLFKNVSFKTLPE